MLIIPAIDIKGGRCVRLRQGRMSDETVFSNVPEEMAARWYECGARRLHIVDLDGAVRGRPVNREVIRRIVNSVPIPVELGGGIRDMDALEAYFSLGLKYLILGTAAHRDPDFVHRASDAFPGQIILGIDARNDRISVEAWTQDVDQTPLELARRFDGAGLSAIVYTDINRDGMRTGCNVEATGALAQSIETPVIASGGISGISDVLRILPLREVGVMGMITGRALYDGSLDLTEALKACAGKKIEIKS